MSLFKWGQRTIGGYYAGCVQEIEKTLDEEGHHSKKGIVIRVRELSQRYKESMRDLASMDLILSRERLKQRRLRELINQMAAVGSITAREVNEALTKIDQEIS